KDKSVKFSIKTKANRFGAAFVIVTFTIWSSPSIAKNPCRSNRNFLYDRCSVICKPVRKKNFAKACAIWEKEYGSLFFNHI
ncbi:MAG: hypothetical protein EB086_11335, partial [Rhodobacteraceae bacterium]|nr:hypothetical protein [Paracoccaceae bacterium]